MAVYLDYNASTPVDERVLARMIDIYRLHYGNADSRTHIFGTEAKEIVVASRKTLADILGIDSTDLFLPVVLPKVITWQYLACLNMHLKAAEITLLLRQSSINQF